MKEGVGMGLQEWISATYDCSEVLIFYNPAGLSGGKEEGESKKEEREDLCFRTKSRSFVFKLCMHF